MSHGPGERPIRIISAYWQSEPGQVGWEVERTPGGERDLRSIADAPPEGVRLPAAVGDPSPRPQFDEWLSGTHFLQWWSVAAAEGIDDNVFVLRDFPEGVWQFPWELLLERLEKVSDVHHRVAVVRGIDEPRPEAPTKFAEQLRVLHLTGDPAGLNLKAEVESIREAWNSLGHEVQLRVKCPIQSPAEEEKLVELFRREQPHVIWFSGHGRVQDGRTELLFANGKWVSAGRLAAAIARTGVPSPLYALFWACDSGRDTDSSDAGLAFTPDLFRLLRDQDVMSAVVMQAPIGDRTSQFLARELFAHLGAGYSLTVALIRARAKLLDELSSYADDPRALDWAAPALWTSGTPVAALDWGSGTAARSQMFGEDGFRKSLVARIPGEGSVERAPSLEEIARASVWAQGKRTWIQGEVEDTELRIDFLRVLQAIQADGSLTVLLLDASKDSTDLSLRAWAEGVYCWLRPGDVEPALAEAIARVKYSALDAWPELCALDRVCLAIADPPPADVGWFWDPLRADGRSEPTIILSADPPEEGHGTWQFDSLSASAKPEKIDEILARAPRLARALAVLDVPLSRKHLVLRHPKPDDVETLAQWEGGTALLVRVRYALAMASTARARVLAEMTPEQRWDAHWDAASMLTRLPRGTDLGMRIQHHLILAEDYEVAAGQTAWLINRLTGRPRQLLATVAKLGRHERKLPSEVAVLVARAHVALREQEAAERWLIRSRAAGAINLALEESTWALVEKAKGTRKSYELAFRHAENAIKYARKGRNRQREWQYRQDQALLLQHNFGEPGRAASIYLKLIEEIESLGAPESGDEIARTLAVIKRNCCECVRQEADIGVGAGDVDPAVLLFEAEVLVRDSSAPVWAEILYEQAKQATGKKEEKRHLERCVVVAQEIGHATMEAIALNRLYWMDANDALAGWAGIESRLRIFQLDGWVARTLIKGRLRAARRLCESDRIRARSQLARNREFLERFDIATGGKRDKKRIAQTYAGLSVLAPSRGVDDPWKRFQKLEWAADWLKEEGHPDASTVWDREVV